MGILFSPAGNIVFRDGSIVFLEGEPIYCPCCCGKLSTPVQVQLSVMPGGFCLNENPECKTDHNGDYWYEELNGPGGSFNVSSPFGGSGGDVHQDLADRIRFNSSNGTCTGSSERFVFGRMLRPVVSFHDDCSIRRAYLRWARAVDFSVNPDAYVFDSGVLPEDQYRLGDVIPNAITSCSTSTPWPGGTAVVDQGGI